MKLLDLFLKHKQVSTDTRKITPGSIFFALKGPNFNGNKFVVEAISKGASYCVIDEEQYETANTILVKDVLKSLQDLARDYRKLRGYKVIAITGSNGKTTTKELLHSVLATNYKVQATPGNFNNHIGVPLTLLSLKQDTEIAIIEMGDNKPGDIQELCEIALPDYGYITNVGKDHLEGYGSMAKNAATKNELYQYISNQRKINFFDSADPFLEQYSIGENSIDIRSLLSDNIIEQIDTGIKVSFRLKAKDYHSQLVGSYNFQNILVTCAIALHFNVSPEQIGNAIGNYTPENNRSQLLKTMANTLVMDAYNSNPSSLLLSFQSFVKSRHENQKGVILGDMLELGTIAEEEHKQVLEMLISSSIDPQMVYLVGSLFGQFNNEYPFQFYQTVDDLKIDLTNKPIKNTFLLLKGSRGIRLEKLVDAL